MRGEHIKATMLHDEGAYAQCSYCKRYSDDPDVLRGNIVIACDCGNILGWSGSFKKPDATACWSGWKPGDRLLFCPFCGQQDFDRVGLKRHLQWGHCEEYEKQGTDDPGCT